MNTPVRVTSLLYIFVVLLLMSCQGDQSTVLRDDMFLEHAVQRMEVLSNQDDNSSNIELAMLGDSHFEFMKMDFLPYRSINLGIRGDTVYAILTRAKAYKSVSEARIVGLSLGTNNVAQGVSNKITVRQVAGLVEKYPDKVFVLALLNPLSESKGFVEFNEKLLQINNLLLDEFEKNERVFLMPSMAEGENFSLDDRYYGEDGIHFSEYGYSQWNTLWLNALASTKF